MNDIYTAREQLLACERQRPGPGQSSVFWENGSWWRQAFDDLIAAECALDTRYTALAEGAPAGDTTAARHLMFLADTIRESGEWYRGLLAMLQDAARAWEGGQQAPQSLREHMALVELRICTCEVRRALIALEYLEHRRLAKGGLDEGQWQQVWSEVFNAFRAQSAAYKRLYNQDLPERIHSDRLAALERIYRMQADTRKYWSGLRDVDIAGLEADMRALARFIESLRPRREEPGCSPGIVFVGIVVLIVIALAGLSGRGQSAGAPAATGSQQAAGVVGEAQPLQPGEIPPEAQTRNNDGIALLRQGRCEEAIRAFDEALAAAPGWYEPHNNRAFCQYDLDRREEALQAWRKALELNPQSADANAGLGMALYAADERAEGQRLYDQAVAIEPRYLDPAWLRTERHWSERAIGDSAPLRGAVAPEPTVFFAPKESP